MTTIKKIFFNTSSQFAGKLITSGVTLLITFLIARQLGPLGFGDLTKILAFVAPFYMVVDFGFNAIAVKRIGEETGESTKLFNNLLSLRLVFSAILIVALLVIVLILPYAAASDTGFSPLVKWGIIIYALTIFSQAALLSANAIFQIKLRYDQSVLVLAAGYLATLAFILLTIIFSWGFLAFVISYVAGGVVIILSSLLLVKKYLATIRWEFNFPLWKNLIIQTLPLAITLIFNVVYFRADIFLLSLMRPSQEVGFYGLAYKFFEVILVAPTFFMNAVYPFLIVYFKENLTKFQKAIWQALLFLFLSAVIISVITFIFAPWIILIIGGANFDQSVFALRILVLSVPFFYASSLFMWVLITTGQQKKLAVFYGVGAISNIVLNLILIPRYGFLAAAVTTGLTEAFVLILTATASLKYLRKGVKNDS